MKKLLFIAFFFAFAGFSVAQTTQQEYNYCRNSLLNDRFSGRGYLPGYNVLDYFDGDGSSNVGVLLFNNAKGTTKAIVMVVKLPDNKSIPVVIPIGENKSLWGQTYNDIARVNKINPAYGNSLSLYMGSVAASLVARVDSLEGIK